MVTSEPPRDKLGVGPDEVLDRKLVRERFCDHTQILLAPVMPADDDHGLKTSIAKGPELIQQRFQNEMRSNAARKGFTPPITSFSHGAWYPASWTW
jgi:hypothetical protein